MSVDLPLHTIWYLHPSGIRSRSDPIVQQLMQVQLLLSAHGERAVFHFIYQLTVDAINVYKPASSSPHEN